MMPGSTMMGNRFAQGGDIGPLARGNMNDRMLQAIKEMDAKKAKKIKQLLTKEQLPRYKTIRKMQNKELEKHFREMRENGR